MVSKHPVLLQYLSQGSDLFRIDLLHTNVLLGPNGKFPVKSGLDAYEDV